MKKILFLLLTLTLLLGACGKAQDQSAEQLMSRLDISEGYKYINGCDISSVNYISAERLNYLYYGEQTPLAELDCTESYCIYISPCLGIDEIHIFKAKHQSDVDSLKRMLESRSKLLSKPQINPTDSDFIAETAVECRVFSKGRFVFLTAGEGCKHADSISALF